MRLWLFFAGLSGACGVVLGAWGAHGFAGSVAAKTLFDTALRWQFWHIPGLLAAALLVPRATSVLAERVLFVSGAAFAAGTVLFCGTLYMQAITGVAPVPMAAPAGGFCFILGWAALAVSALMRPVRR
jgi:uncharacterized membrane protein YgdD (TMEM256/DUF423 family)